MFPYSFLGLAVDAVHASVFGGLMVLPHFYVYAVLGSRAGLAVTSVSVLPEEDMFIFSAYGSTVDTCSHLWLRSCWNSHISCVKVDTHAEHRVVPARAVRTWERGHYFSTWYLAVTCSVYLAP